MTSLTHVPPAPDAVARLRAMPSFQADGYQRIIDRLASGEIGQEETAYLFQQEAKGIAEIVVAQRQQQEAEDARNDSVQHQREQQDKQMGENQHQAEPQVIVVEPAPVGRVLSAAGAVDAVPSPPGPPPAPLKGTGGASGSWGPPVPSNGNSGSVGEELAPPAPKNGTGGSVGQELAPPANSIPYVSYEGEEAEGMSYDDNSAPGVEYD